MKTNFYLILFINLFFNSLLYAKGNSLPETKEIIGSGIFSVNQTRSFSTDSNTLYYLDNQPIDIVTFEIIGSGFKSAFTLLDDVNSGVTSGTVNAIELITNLQGPVTSVVPLMVLEQPVLTTSNTLQTVTSSLQLNQNIAVSGYLSSNNSLKASKLMDPLNDIWKIRGYAHNINNVAFTVGSLLINRGSEQILECANGFNNGQLVELQMLADSAYQAGVAIDTLISIKCLRVNQLANETSSLPSVVQGFITKSRGQNFWINDIQVNINQSTLFENGEQGFLELATNVEVQGTLDTQTSQIQAQVIRFIDHRIEVTFPIDPQDIILNQSVSINGIVFLKTPQTVDNSNILRDGINSSRKIQIKGYIDSQGTAYISKISNKGAANFNNLSVRGDVNMLNNPLFSLFNFDINTSNSLIVNQGAGVIDETEFYNSIQIGSQIEVKNATFDISTNQLINANIFIRKAQSLPQAKQSRPVTKEIIGSGVIGGFTTATITKTSNQLFLSSFE